ncbi:centromere protein U isoform X2 [Cheilinus undulatus]|uniref:centromere protein U isoform X2 n=1 Tax=Cheilinus undulatus TaxID=241271 RepID=UPI001BD5EA0D|nr:centromere protein U isoform X2 [Cheilinus undulatus]
MRAKKGRNTRAVKDQDQKGSAVDHMESPNLSAIERASFMEDLQRNFGSPLHSTAVEEELGVTEEQKETAGRKDVLKTSKTLDKGKRKETERDGEEEEMTKKKRRRSSGRKVTARKINNQQVKQSQKTERQPGQEKSRAPEPQEDSDVDPVLGPQRPVLSSDEEVADEGTSWEPSPKKTRGSGLGGTRKSSSRRVSASGRSSGESDEADTDKRRRKNRGGQRGTELEVVLDAFSDFCEQYRESVESKAVKQSIDSFSTNVKHQLMEKISAQKELRGLKRGNVQVGSMIRKKMQRLLDAKHEMMRAERQLFLHQKETDELQLRLADLRQGQAFLCDLRDLNQRYLDYRHKHPRKKETYGTSSVPALQLEKKLVKAAEHQCKDKNNPQGKRREKEPQE